MLFRHYLNIIFTYMLAADAAAADAAAAWIIVWAYVDFKMLSLGLDIYTLIIHVLWLSQICEGKRDIYKYIQMKTILYYDNDDSYQTYLTKNTLESNCIYTPRILKLMLLMLRNDECKWQIELLFF